MTCACVLRYTRIHFSQFLRIVTPARHGHRPTRPTGTGAGTGDRYRWFTSLRVVRFSRFSAGAAVSVA
jgi:hypothetical protein